MNQSKPNKSTLQKLAQLRRQYAELKAAYKKNIAGQKHTDETLDESKEKYFAIFENLPYATSLSKLTDGTFVAVNEAFEKEFGFTKHEVLGKNSRDLGINPDKEGRKRILKALKENNSVHNQEIILLSKSGEKNYYETNIDKVVINGEEYLLSTTQNIRKYKKADTELIKAKSTVEKSETRYRTIVSNSPLVTFVLNPDGIFTLSEGKGLEKLGLKPGEVVGLSALELYKDYPVIINDIKKALAGNISRSEIVLSGGVFDVFYAPVFDKKGKLLEVIGVANDITERKQAEEELLKSKSNLEEYFENDISADYTVSVSGEIFSCNKTFLSLFGFEKKSEIEKFDITGLYKNPEDRKQMIALIKNQRKVENFEVEFISKDGKTIYALINAIGIFSKDDQLEKIRGYIVDISEQKNIETELQKSEEKYRLLFFNNPQPMWIYDLETLAILEVNHAAIKHYGYSKEEFLSMTLKDIRPPEDIPDLLEDIKKTRSSLNTAGEWRHLKKNGELIDVEITSHSVLFTDRKARHILINDITERKRMQFEYQTMIKSSRDGFWIVDAQNSKFIEVNQSYCEMIGYSREEMLNMTIQDVEAVETQEETKQHIELIMETGYDSFESKHKTKSGRLIDIDASVTFIGSDINKFFVFVKEISERKKVENEVLKLSHTVEQSPASIIITDLDGNMEYVNPRTLEITGYTKEELIGKNPRIFNSDEKPKEEYRQLWSTILSGKEWFGEFHNKKKNGELYWESASISPIINQKQEIINYVAIKEDITERKRFEDTRKILLEIAQLATKLVTLTSFLAEVHQKIKQIIRADNFYVALYNETSNTFSFPYHVDEYDKVELNKPYDFNKSYTDHVLKTNQSLIITPEYQLDVEKDGTINGRGDELSVWLGVPLKTKENSKPSGVIAIQDYKNTETYTESDRSVMEIIAHNIGSFIERIKYVEKLIRAKEKAEESDRLKSAFLANMSHEIRTPMNGIIGFTQLLLEPDLSSEEKEGYIMNVNKSGQRMLNTVTDIVEISKIEAGLVNVLVKNIDFNERLEELFRFFQPEAERKGLKLMLEMLLPADKKIISTDQNKLDSILTNLIKNAIKYTESGTIIMGCETVDTSETFGDRSSLQFYIKDTGIGVPKHRQEAIFDRFIQADIADIRAFQGSGLGLAISKSYVEMLGGKIWVESLEAKGSTFYFTLPFKNNNEEKSSEKVDVISNTKKKKADFKKLKILIVEDDETSLDYLSIIVKDFSAKLLQAGIAIDAIELCRNTKNLDLILMDIRMPGMDGYEATRRIREFNKDVVIIAQTAYALSGDREKALESGCNDYISKPVKRGELIEKIEKYFKNKD